MPGMRERSVNRRAFLGLTGGGILGSVAGCVDRLRRRTYHHITVDGVERQYRLHVPSAITRADDTTSVPLVVALHGGVGSARQFQRTSGFDATADREEFIVAYPDGLGFTENSIHMWNTGYLDSKRDDVDDVRFLRTVIETLVEAYPIDDSAIYLVGHSMGAMMTHRMGAEHPELFAAIAPVSGAVGGRTCEGCPLVTPPDPSEPLSVVYSHGTADTNTPFDGGAPESGIKRKHRYDLSANETVEWWVERNNCRSIPSIEKTTNVERRVYDDGDADTTVEFLIFDGAGHFWDDFNTVIETDPALPSASIADLLWNRLAAV